MQKRREQEAPLFLPSMLVTSRGDLGLAMHFLWVVVDEGITTPIDQTELKARVENLLAVQRLSLELHVQYQRLFDNVPLGLYHTSREGTILDANPAMVRILGFASAEETIGRLARVLAREMGFSEEKIREVSIAGLLHDIGKIAIPGEIPNKPAKLAPLERAIVEEHPKKGYDIVSSVELLAP
ncbi:HD domain-containing phosphohydrolase [Candidatus Caldatribacterium sp. SIUC1]|uniref:HD domain-containing phosphohydrolase n=1 Tax=Candidatus Caldatribacterium sp. SIUC1 TaxID=3418365 RepID=UPI003F6931CB